MKPANPRILTNNGGSSSIKFALFEAGDPLRRILEGGIVRIGLPDATLRVKGLNQADNFSRSVTAPNHTVAVGALMDWIEERSGRDALTAVGHRVVHGGPKYSQPRRITPEMVAELRGLSPFDRAPQNPSQRVTGLEQRELDARRATIDRQDVWVSCFHGSLLRHSATFRKGGCSNGFTL